MMLVGARSHFCASHSLPQHSGLHGHSYEVWAYSENIDAEAWQTKLILVCGELDHCVLNEKIPNPTMEEIALYIAAKMTTVHPHEAKEWRPKMVRIIRPVEGLCAEYEP